MSSSGLNCLSRGLPPGKSPGLRRLPTRAGGRCVTSCLSLPALGAVTFSKRFPETTGEVARGRGVLGIGGNQSSSARAGVVLRREEGAQPWDPGAGGGRGDPARGTRPLGATRINFTSSWEGLGHPGVVFYSPAMNLSANLSDLALPPKYSPDPRFLPSQAVTTLGHIVHICLMEDLDSLMEDLDFAAFFGSPRLCSAHGCRLRSLLKT